MINDPIFTPDHLRQAFINWRKGVLAPPIILESRFAHRNAGTTHYEADQHMRHVVDGVMLRRLRRARIMLGINHVDCAPPNAQTVLSEVHHDFTTMHRNSPNQSRTLRTWSAVYHQLAVRPAVPIAALAEAAELDTAHFRRYVTIGLDELCAELHEHVTWSIR